MSGGGRLGGLPFVVLRRAGRGVGIVSGPAQTHWVDSCEVEIGVNWADYGAEHDQDEQDYEGCRHYHLSCGIDFYYAIMKAGIFDIIIERDKMAEVPIYRDDYIAPTLSLVWLNKNRDGHSKR